MLSSLSLCPQSLFVRSTSHMSTAEGSVTPVTDVSTPSMRLSDMAIPGISISLPLGKCASLSSNILRLRLKESFRIEEYFFEGSVDLACCYFDRMKDFTKAIKLFIFRRDEANQLTVLALVPSRILRLSNSPHDGVLPIVHVVSHLDNCSCATCGKMLQILLTSSLKDAGYDRLTRLDFGRCSRSNQLPGLHINIFDNLFSPLGGSMVGIDSLTKPIDYSNNLLACLLRLMNRGTTVHDINSQLQGTPLVSAYSSRVYRLKRIRFDVKPCDTFFNKKTNQLISYTDYLASAYGFVVKSVHSPMVEVYPEKRSESCLVVPEAMCVVSNTVRSPPRNSKISPRSRRTIIDSLVSTIASTIDTSLLELERINMDGLIIDSSCSVPLFTPCPTTARWVLYLEDPTRLTASCIDSLVERIGFGPPTEMITNLSEIHCKPNFVVCLINGEMYSRVKYDCLVSLRLSDSTLWLVYATLKNA